jgi:hypothetical protein
MDINRYFYKNQYIQNSNNSFIYILAHVQAWLLPNLSLPFAIEISLICISYYCFGVYFKEYILAKKAVIISYFITIAFAFLRGLDVTQYGFELYRHHYTDIILDFIIPISLSITLFSVCKLISTKKISQYVSYIGTITLPIMCLHIIINWFVGRFLEYGWLMFVIIGFIIPVLIAKFVFEKSKLLSILFLGKMQ